MRGGSKELEQLVYGRLGNKINRVRSLCSAGICPRSGLWWGDETSLCCPSFDCEASEWILGVFWGENVLFLQGGSPGEVLQHRKPCFGLILAQAESSRCL